MEITKKTAKLIYDLEYIIAHHFSSVGINGGIPYRHHLRITDYSVDKEHGITIEFEGNVNNSFSANEYTDPSILFNAYYRMGKGECFTVCAGILDVLQEIEKRYNLDFNKLEEELQSHNTD